MTTQDESSGSSNPTGKKSLAVALGTLFLFSVAGIVVEHVQGPSASDVNIFFPGQITQLYTGTLSAQVRADQAFSFEAPDLLLFGKTSLRASTPHMSVSANALGALIGDSPLQTNSREIVHYVVEEGDTMAGLAERFGISVQTIAWANDLSSSSSFAPGKELIILPVSGALHLVRPADTLSEIALWYEGDVEEILRFNGIADAKDIFAGDLIIVPGGKQPAVVPSGRLTQIAGSYFIKPVPSSYRLTQGLHPFNAVDLSNGTCGGPAYAAAGGVVQRAGYHSVAGNYVRVLHDNGVVTLYGHLSGQTVTPGERVLQGQIVGYIGHSGQTIPSGPAGCHLHFEVRGAANPFAA